MPSSSPARLLQCLVIKIYERNFLLWTFLWNKLYTWRWLVLLILLARIYFVRWMYRIQPSANHKPFSKVFKMMSIAMFVSVPFKILFFNLYLCVVHSRRCMDKQFWQMRAGSEPGIKFVDCHSTYIDHNLSTNKWHKMRWSPFDLPGSDKSVDFVEGVSTVCGAGSPEVSLCLITAFIYLLHSYFGTSLCSFWSFIICHIILLKSWFMQKIYFYLSNRVRFAAALLFTYMHAMCRWWTKASIILMETF